MCGINGIFAFGPNAARVDERELLATRDHMARRGPDGKGSWISENGRIGFAHRRLAIIDLTVAGAQPMSSADGQVVITFNGEIYNYRELRADLERKGVTFRSASDTEVLLALYQAKGEHMVDDLVGMFTFAIWDARKKSLFLARDPYGIKPLYYTQREGTFRFASQVKALIAGGAVSATPDPAGLVGYHLMGSVPEPFTIARDVRLLPAGHRLWVDENGAGDPRAYHSIAAVYAENLPGGRVENRQEAFREALAASVKRHLVADVPVGAFLSSGIDSGALVGLMRDAGQSDIETVTLSFEEFRQSDADEAPLAEEVARLYGTRHTTRVITKAEFESEIPKIFEAMDQPSIDGVNTWFVSKAARELGLKVAISGVGGDELLGGYPSFRDIPRWKRMTRLPSRVPLLGQSLRKAFVATRASRLGISPKAAGLLEYGASDAGAWMLRRAVRMPWQLGEVLPSEVIEEGLERLRPLAHIDHVLHPDPGSPFARIATLEASLYMRNQLLRDTDWAGMYHSLEIRTPLADSALLRAAAVLGPPHPGHRAKAELAFAPSKPLPDAVVNRPKSGFAVPVGAWISGALQGERSKPFAGMARWAKHVIDRWNAGADTPALSI